MFLLCQYLIHNSYVRGENPKRDGGICLADMLWRTSMSVMEIGVRCEYIGHQAGMSAICRPYIPFEFAHSLTNLYSIIESLTLKRFAQDVTPLYIVCYASIGPSDLGALVYPFILDQSGRPPLVWLPQFPSSLVSLEHKEQIRVISFTESYKYSVLFLPRQSECTSSPFVLHNPLCSYITQLI